MTFDLGIFGGGLLMEEGEQIPRERRASVSLFCSPRIQGSLS